MDSTQTVLVIGGGQLGSRHLQALKSVSSPLNIQVVDPSEKSLSVARERYESIPLGPASHSVAYFKSIEEAVSHFPAGRPVDLAIIATSSKPRFEVLEELFKYRPAKFLVLEKILFDRVEQYSRAKELLERAGSRAWVNFAMREREVCKQMHREIRGERITYLAGFGGQGLVTNAIHYVDHMVQLTGCTKFMIDTSGLEKKTLESKRAGYLELTGTIVARFEDGSLGVFSAQEGGSAPPMIEIHSPKHKFLMREKDHRMWVARADSGWVWTEESSEFPPQSKLTTGVVNRILRESLCDLTPFNEAVPTHLQFLEPLKVFCEQVVGKKLDTFPFT